MSSSCLGRAVRVLGRVLSARRRELRGDCLAPPSRAARRAGRPTARARRPLASLSPGASRQPRPAARGDHARARAPGARPQGLGAAPSRRAGRRRGGRFASGEAFPSLAPPGGCRLHSPSSSSLRPSPRSSHIIAPLSRPRASSAGAAARLSLAEMMGLCAGRVAPRKVGVHRRPGLHSSPADGSRRKPVS